MWFKQVSTLNRSIQKQFIFTFTRSFLNFPKHELYKLNVSYDVYKNEHSCLVRNATDEGNVQAPNRDWESIFTARAKTQDTQGGDGKEQKKHRRL